MHFNFHDGEMPIEDVFLDPDHTPHPSRIFLAAEREQHALADAPDGVIVDRVARRIAVPREAAADSFILHAPLELMARASLLALALPRARPLVRARILTLGALFEDRGPARAEPARRSFATLDDARGALASAIGRGELDDAEVAADFLATNTSAAELARAVADVIVPHLGAAAHGSIFLDELRRVGSRSSPIARSLGGLCRELAREAGALLRWQQSREPDVVPTGDLAQRLAATTCVGDPGSNFILPTMSFVERSGLAKRLLDPATRAISVREARRALGRVAAISMLVDDPAHAPYGWSHALTMPRAVLAIAADSSDPGRAVAVAATYVLGFRATLARGAIDLGYTPPATPRVDRWDLAAPEGLAASRVFHASPEELPELVTQIATYAAVHPDAHLAKYVLASLDAAREAPEDARLHLAAAANLASIWARTKSEDPFLAAYERHTRGH